jgi:hypothetical protein
MRILLFLQLRPQILLQVRFRKITFIVPGLFAAPGKFIFFAKIGKTISEG